MSAAKREVQIDPRVYLALILTGSIATIYIHTEYGMAVMFAVSLLWQLIAAKGKGFFGYIFTYLFLFGIAHAAIWWVSGNAGNTTAVTLASFGVSGRKALIPLMFAILLARTPTGSFMGALNAMKIPKTVSIGVAIGLRFFPTVAQEYRQIRNAQRFRGVGIGFWNTLFHLPKVLEYILLPLIVRIVRISEELSASVTVRGVRFNNQIISYRPVHICGKDMALFGGTLALYVLIFLSDRYMLGVLT
ncbi:MAG: energy-coupling factor transporter transmembrane component T [Lachnospiraceae bacterium]